MRQWIVGLMILWTGMALAATPKKAVLDVENMTCPACSITIEKALDKVPGVSKARVDAKAATRVCRFLCNRGLGSLLRKPLRVSDRKLVQRGLPVADRHRPFLADVA